ncbi:sulfite exporter TauE/SafE family protein [Roseivirga sp. BDSF3-8]|uniref:sulfite exporter TauE/SafE family protein n=1 Tax=Roseivirga sp. BDSF3-8 TaxID=3241598 RepID=UPI0035322E6B
MIEILLLLVSGLAGGFLAGLLGIGGGVIYIIILPYALSHVGVPSEEIVQYTIANSILGTFFASLSGNIAHMRKNEFYFSETLNVGVFAVIFSLGSLYLIVNTPWYDRTAFNVLVIALLLFILFRTIWLNTRKRPDDEEPKTRFSLLAVAGSSGGLIASLSGLGGGAIMVPILNLGLKMDIKQAKSISLGVISMSSLGMTIYNSFEQTRYPFQYYNWGYIVWPIALALSAGVVIGSPIGVKVGRKISSRTISFIFSAFLLVVIIKKALELYNA